MIEKFCPGLALCSVYNHLFLLCSSKTIFPIRAALSYFCHWLGWKPGLWSAHLQYCALQTVFYWMLHAERWWSYPRAQNSHCHLILETVPYQDLWLSLMFVLTVISSCKTHSQGWMSHSTQALCPCLGSVSWSSPHHKSGDKRVVIIPSDEWRMPWAHLPRAQVTSTDTPEVAGLAPPAALTFSGRLGHCGATMCRSPGAAVPACSLWRFPWGLPHLPLQDPALPS